MRYRRWLLGACAAGAGVIVVLVVLSQRYVIEPNSAGMSVRLDRWTGEVIWIDRDGIPSAWSQWWMNDWKVKKYERELRTNDLKVKQFERELTTIRRPCLSALDSVEHVIDPNKPIASFEDALREAVDPVRRRAEAIEEIATCRAALLGESSKVATK